MTEISIHQKLISDIEVLPDEYLLKIWEFIKANGFFKMAEK